MEPNANQMFEHARARFNHESARRLLKEKYEARMIFAHAEGMWRAGPELIVLLHTCLGNDTVILTDLYENPVRVDPAKLLEMSQQRWQEQMTAWLLEHQENSARR